MAWFFMQYWGYGTVLVYIFIEKFIKMLLLEKIPMNFFSWQAWLISDEEETGL